jgi:hypothetical protein
MKVAELLSDLKSLSPELCPPEAALKLVSVNRAQTLDTPSADITNPPSPKDTRRLDPSTPQLLKSHSETDDDPDIKRAKELVALHYDVKVKYMESGLDRELLQARNDVADVLDSLLQRRE